MIENRFTTAYFLGAFRPFSFHEWLIQFPNNRTNFPLPILCPWAAVKGNADLLGMDQGRLAENAAEKIVNGLSQMNSTNVNRHATHICSKFDARHQK